MKNLLKRIFILLDWRSRARTVGSAISQPLPAAPEAPQWFPECEQAWKTFLATNAGLTLMGRLRAVECQVAIAACSNPMNTVHAAGAANGWTECRQWLESLSRSSTRNQGGPLAEADLPDHDVQPPAEAELYERFSA